MDLTEFNEIRPYNDEELPQIFEELIADPAFQKAVTGVIPNVPFELLAQKMRACKTKREFQEAFCYGICAGTYRFFDIRPFAYTGS